MVQSVKTLLPAIVERGPHEGFLNGLLRSLTEHIVNVQAAIDELDDSSESQRIYRGSGNPNGVVTADMGSIYLNSAGGAATTLYVKESSPTPNTGWVGK